jgi:diguanylate cyclase (GGDEF) domain
MKYTGRIIGTIFVVIATIIGRILAYIYFKYPLTALPIPAIVALLLAYWFGKKYDQVKFFSEKDSLTNIYNRRFVYEKFLKLSAHENKNTVHIGILIFDCDKFKVINDTYGHVNGDLVLKEIAAILWQTKRKSDIVSRWGGDEFLVIQFDTKEAEIQAHIRHINAQLQNLSQKLAMPISVSSGYALHLRDGIILDDLITHADCMMYKNKENDR